MTISADPTALKIPARYTEVHDRAYEQIVAPWTSHDGAERRARGDGYVRAVGVHDQRPALGRALVLLP
jgi:hypothetical protein